MAPKVAANAFSPRNFVFGPPHRGRKVG
jgi:hypothetical protein